MSYFEDQMEAWEDNNCQGDPSDMDPYVFWADRISDCESKGHGKWKWETAEDNNGKKHRVQVCQTCKVIKK